MRDQTRGRDFSGLVNCPGFPSESKMVQGYFLFRPTPDAIACDKHSLPSRADRSNALMIANLNRIRPGRLSLPIFISIPSACHRVECVTPRSTEKFQIKINHQKKIPKGMYKDPRNPRSWFYVD